MYTIISCYRCLLLLFLPFLFIFTVLYFTTTPPSITTDSPSLDKSTTKSITTRSTITPLTTRSIAPCVSTTPKPIWVTVDEPNCNLFNISDSRPFFDREPPQKNLPRRISTTEHHNLLPRLRSTQIAFVACACNVENNIDQFQKYVEPIIDLFHPSSRIIIVESDSTDNTLSKLQQWPRAEIHTYGKLSKTVPRRTERIAHCRNKLLEKVREFQPDYMIMADLDIFAANVSSFLSNFEYNTDDWSVMTANLLDTYYDIRALRTLSDSNLNYDVWHRIWAMQLLNDYCIIPMREKLISIHQKLFPPERNLLEVRSAFDGAGIYKMEAIEGCNYSGDFYTCEHVSFHICMRDRNKARIFINPKFTNKWLSKKV